LKSGTTKEVSYQKLNSCALSGNKVVAAFQDVRVRNDVGGSHDLVGFGCIPVFDGENQNKPSLRKAS